MLGEIITTFAGASLVIGMGLAGGTVHRTTPSPSLQWSQEAGMEGAKLQRAAMIPGAGAGGLADDFSSAEDPGKEATSPEPPAGVVAGLIISADMFVGNTDSDRHTFIVRPVDGGREFKARVVGMAEDRASGEQAPIAPDTTAIPPLSGPGEVRASGIDSLSAKIRA